jgi:hypothetical protein
VPTIGPHITHEATARSMRIRGLVRSLPLLFLVLAAPTLLCAQFTQPTDEELKMTSDPKAPGASAVYLYREDVTDDTTHTHTIYERIKILSEKGKDLATKHLSYLRFRDTVSDIQGRTIHADGTIIPLTAKPSDLMAFKAGFFEVDEIVFALPSAEVGSILEFRLTIKTNPFSSATPVWNVQTSYFVHKEHFQFHDAVTPGFYIPDRNGEPLDRLMTTEFLPAGTVVGFDKSKSIFSLDLTDLPAIPDEDWTPPLNRLKWRVEFYYTNSKTPVQYWESALNLWSKDAQDFTAPSGNLKKAVSAIVTEGDTDDQKARKIYAAVQKLDNTSFSRTRSEAERKKEKLKVIRKADDVWKNQSGSRDEIALLFIALARAASLNALPLQVVNRDRAIFDSHMLSTRQLEDYLADVIVDGKDVYLDPGERLCPYGTLHWKHTLASGFKLGDKGPITTPAISFKSAIVHRVADLNVDATGNVTGTIFYAMSGPDALKWRQLSLENDQDEVKKQFKEATQDDLPEGVQSEFDRFQALDDPSVDLVAQLKVTGTLGSITGKHFLLPGLFFESRGKHPFVAQDKRITPIDVHYPKLEQDDVTYHLPSGFSVESTLQPANTSWPNHAMLKVASSGSTGSAKITRSLAYNFTLLEASEYPNLHDFYQKVAAADQQQLVLTRIPAAGGN